MSTLAFLLRATKKTRGYVHDRSALSGGIKRNFESKKNGEETPLPQKINEQMQKIKFIHSYFCKLIRLVLLESLCSVHIY